MIRGIIALKSPKCVSIGSRTAEDSGHGFPEGCNSCSQRLLGDDVEDLRRSVIVGVRVKTGDNSEIGEIAMCHISVEIYESKRS